MFGDLPMCWATFDSGKIFSGAMLGIRIVLGILDKGLVKTAGLGVAKARLPVDSF